jgi:hypothetical protein
MGNGGKCCSYQIISYSNWPGGIVGTASTVYNMFANGNVTVSLLYSRRLELIA